MTPAPQLLPEPYHCNDPLDQLRQEAAAAAHHIPTSSELQQTAPANAKKRRRQSRIATTPPPLPQMVTFESDFATMKIQTEDISKRIKNALYTYMFSTNAVPPTKEDRKSLIDRSIKNASQIVLGHSSPPKMGHYHKLCIDTMSNARSAFRKYAENTVEVFFDIDPPVRSGENVIEYRRIAAQGLLNQPGLDVFHVFHEGDVFYLEHQCISKLIEHVIGMDLKCAGVLQAASMKPLIALAVASFKLALLRRTTAPEEPAAAFFGEAYQGACSFIDGLDGDARATLVTFSSFLISRIPQRVN
ncbi:hypothetical protein JVT61DRAFT_12437 [Boletus reticuloceps]|uniref:Uncharacterized protein n=1 Tax=Boletus reticuloceps TaxID=495285 RepID=A0A8I2YE36_9AGAM|nr:hypothetical protein JVT61DRAFT_12437 [Boletus reticuloceps]